MSRLITLLCLRSNANWKKLQKIPKMRTQQMILLAVLPNAKLALKQNVRKMMMVPSGKRLLLEVHFSFPNLITLKFGSLKYKFRVPVYMTANCCIRV